MSNQQKYCLDSNVLIEVWNKYYSPTFCPAYWTVLNQLGTDGKIFIPKMVKDEILRTEDNLAEWLKSSSIPIHDISESVTKVLQQMYAANESHKYLVDNTRQRSLADPWVIAHAISERAHVVTKEEKVTAANSTRIKIPNVCDNMGVRWLNDFQFLVEMNIHFTCTIKT